MRIPTPTVPINRERRERAVQLFGIISLDDGEHAPPAVSLLTFRELAALVRDVAYARPTATAEEVEAYRSIVETAFKWQPVLPAPFGTVFRTRATLLRWLEVHYFTLVDALSFVHQRAAGRVTVRSVPPRRLESPDGERAEHRPPYPTAARVVDVQATAVEMFRLLRRHAVASVPVAGRDGDGTTEVTASFLVDRDRWPVFADVVREEGKRFPDLDVECTGPWPPYDFVRMQFGE